MCSVKVASTEDAVLSALSDTTTSKTCPCKACHDPVTQVTQHSRQLTRGRAGAPLCKHSSSCQRLPSPAEVAFFSLDKEQVKCSKKKEKDKGAKKERARWDDKKEDRKFTKGEIGTNGMREG